MAIYAHLTHNGLDYAQGDVATEPHVKWVVVLSLQYAPVQPPPPDPDSDQPNPGGGAFIITKPTDSASQKLAMAWHAGIAIDVTLDMTQPVKGNDQSYYKVTATEAIIAQMTFSTDGTGRQIETITLNYHKLTLDEAGQGDDVSGQLPASCYDLGNLGAQLGG